MLRNVISISVWCIYLYYVKLSESSDSEISGRYSPVCSDAEIEAGPVDSEDAVDMTAGRRAANELNAAQVAHDLDELIMEDDESVDEEVPLEGKWIYSRRTFCFNAICNICCTFTYEMKNIQQITLLDIHKIYYKLRNSLFYRR